MEKYVTLVAEIAEYTICVGENLRYANSVHLFVSRVNEMFKVRTATCCICPTVRDRSGSSDSDALKYSPQHNSDVNIHRAAFGRICTGTQTARGSVTVWTDLYWDSNSPWLSDGLDGLVLGLK